VPGVSRPVAIVTPAGHEPGEAGAEAYCKAFDLLEDGDAGAARSFAALHGRFPDDRLVAFHHERCESGCASAQIVIAGKA
jgi:hypothetical protein